MDRTGFSSSAMEGQGLSAAATVSSSSNNNRSYLHQPKMHRELRTNAAVADSRLADYARSKTMV